MIEETDYAFVKSKTTGGHYAFLAERSGKAFCNPMQHPKMIKLTPDDVVADIGAYVGEYSRYAALQGVKAIRSYEATPRTFELLSKNRVDPMEVHNRAVVGDDSKEITLYLSKGIGVTNSIAKSGSKAGSITVPTIRYEDAVKGCSVAKIDVEGAEYGYNIIQPHLRAIILEFHPLVGEDWKGKADKIMADLGEAGYTAVAVPGFNNGWDFHGVWSK
jgi:FkbM family methyltransferase